MYRTYDALVIVIKIAKCEYFISTLYSKSVPQFVQSYYHCNRYCRYGVFQQCWIEDPNKRPTFEDLVQTLNTLLESIAGYLQLGALSPQRECS